MIIFNDKSLNMKFTFHSITQGQRDRLDISWVRENGTHWVIDHINFVYDFYNTNIDNLIFESENEDESRFMQVLLVGCFDRYKGYLGD